MERNTYINTISTNKCIKAKVDSWMTFEGKHNEKYHYELPGDGSSASRDRQTVQ